MNGEEILSRMRARQSAALRTCFQGISERDLLQLLCATPQHAVDILQRHFACSVEDAKAAWNDYVLRYIDGQPTAPLPVELPQRPNRRIRCFQ